MQRVIQKSGFTMLQRVKTKAQEGFTLVELLVVIAIISVLAAIAIPAYNTYAIKSRFTEVQVSADSARAAVETCIATGSCMSGSSIAIVVPSAGVQWPSSVVDGINSTNPATKEAAIAAMLIAMCTSPGVMDSHYTNGTGGDWEGPSCDGTSTTLDGSQGVAAQNSMFNTITSDTISSSNGQIVLSMSFANGGAITLSNRVYSTGAYDANTLSLINASWAGAVAQEASSTAIPGMPLPCVGTAGGVGCAASTKYVQTMSVDSGGTITATATTSYGLSSETFTLNPSYSSGRVVWTASGTCKTRAKGAIC